MKAGYQHDREFSDRYMHRVMQLLGPYVIGVANFRVDTRQATDLVVATNGTTSFAVRIRREGLPASWMRQFTIRSHRDTGATTELAKILKGYCRWMFYGHAKGRDIGIWHLLDLDVFRRRYAAGVRGFRVQNGDGTSFDTFAIDRELVVASSVIDAWRQRVPPTEPQMPNWADPKHTRRCLACLAYLRLDERSRGHRCDS